MFVPVPLNRPTTPLGRGDDPSTLFSGNIEKVQQYLKDHGPFTVLARLGPHCYKNLPLPCETDKGDRKYWLKGAERNPDSSLRLVSVVSIEHCRIPDGVIPVIRYCMGRNYLEQPESYVTSYANFLAGLDAVNKDPNYRELLTMDLGPTRSYHQMQQDALTEASGSDTDVFSIFASLKREPTPQSARINEIGQKIFDQYFRETRNAVTAFRLLVDLHTSLPLDRRDAIEQAWDGVGRGERGLRDARNCRWEG